MVATIAKLCQWPPAAGRGEGDLSPHPPPANAQKVRIEYQPLIEQTFAH